VFRLSSTVHISKPLGVSAIFTSTGGANPGATCTGTNPKDGNPRSVQVLTTGRVTAQ
jgi:hypothetical protein